MDYHFVHQGGFPTITKQRVLSQHQQLIRLDYEQDTKTFDTAKLIEKYLELIESVDVVILSDYAKGSLDKVQALINHANEKNVTVLVDPKSMDFSCYSQASVITPNLKEFEAVVDDCSSNADLTGKGSELCKNLHLSES